MLDLRRSLQEILSPWRPAPALGADAAGPARVSPNHLYMASSGRHEGHGHNGHGDHDDHGHDGHGGHGRNGHDGRDDHGRDGHDDHGHDDHDDHGHDHGGHDGHDDHDDHDDHGHDGHDHSGHDHHDELRFASRRSLIFGLVLISTYMFVEIVGGLLSGSLALLADAGHMATDAAAIALALLAMWLADKGPTAERTFGFYRTEILAALFNAVSLWVVAGYILYEAYHRFVDVPHIEGVLMMVVGVGGLIINLITAWVLHGASQHSLNVEGAFQHVLGDLLGSVAVVVSGVFILTLEWYIVDPILSVLIALFIVYNTRHLVRKIAVVLVEGTPPHIDLYEVFDSLEDVEGVTIVHDLHVWTISSGYDALSAHILVDRGYHGTFDDLLNELREVVKGKYGITHVTLQMEYSTTECDEAHPAWSLLTEKRLERAERLLEGDFAD